MRNSPFWWILIGFMLLLDIYFFQALKAVSGSASARTKTILYTSYWVLSIAAIVILLLLPYLQVEKQTRFARTTIFALIAGLFFSKLIASFFFLIDDVRRGVQWVAGKIFTPKSNGENLTAPDTISRSAFLSWAGMIMGGGLFGTLIYGFGNKYRYQVKRVKLTYSNLPSAFKGIKIVHISDIHSGSFNNKEAVMKGVYKIMKEQPDLILFTGDLVNNMASEMTDYMDVFDKLTAPLGVYSTLGNHDYGDYVKWESDELKTANLEELKKVHAKLGWRLLNDEHVAI